MKWQQKVTSFFTPKRMAVEPEKHEDGLDKDGEVQDSLVDVSYSKFQYHSLTQIIFEMTQFNPFIPGTFTRDNPTILW